MKLLSAKAMKDMDNYAINVMGIPSVQLMDTAAGYIADAAMAFCKNGTAAFFCGSGNNGGDGICAAVKLMEKGVKVRVFLTGNRGKMTADTRTMTERLINAGGQLEELSVSQDASQYTKTCDVIIDAMFGIGLNSPLRGDALSAVSIIKQSGAKVVAADIPSGISADTGEVLGDAVCADVTVTFTAGKPGLYTTPGCLYAGEVVICDIGIPKELSDSFSADVFAVLPDEITLPKRRKDSHKSTYGRDLIIGGAVGYTGAPYLAASAASRTGAGLVTAAVPESIYPITASKCAEIMALPLPSCEKGMISQTAAKKIYDLLRSCSVCLFGPGMGKSAGVEAVAELIVNSSEVPLVIDADGINAVAKNIDILKGASCPVVLTPHEGEFKRLGGSLKEGRINGAREFSEKNDCITVLKGYRTVIALPDGQVYINMTGGPSLAKGGSGDVLAGMTASLIGQGFPVKDAVLAAVMLHGRAGDLAAEKLGEYSVTAPDVIDNIAEAIKERMER